MRQILMECLPLGVIGATLGVMLAIWGVDLLSSLLPSTLPRGNQITVNPRVLLFTSGLSILAILIFGLLPAVQAGRSDVRSSLNEGGRGAMGSRKQGRARRLLVVTEVALALALLVGSGLIVRSFLKLSNVETGVTAQNLLTMRVPLPESKYPEPLNADDPREPAGLDFYQQLVARVKELPGVESASVGSSIPLSSGGGWGKFLTIEGREVPAGSEEPIVNFVLISPTYFDSLGINLKRGRAFTDHDTGTSQQVAIINESIARRFFPNQDPIGKTLFMGPPEHLLPRGLQATGFRFPRRTIVAIQRLRC